MIRYLQTAKIAALLYEISITDAADTRQIDQKYTQWHNYIFCRPLARIGFMAPAPGNIVGSVNRNTVYPGFLAFHVTKFSPPRDNYPDLCH